MHTIERLSKSHSNEHTPKRERLPCPGMAQDTSDSKYIPRPTRLPVTKFSFPERRYSSWIGGDYKTLTACRKKWNGAVHMQRREGTKQSYRNAVRLESPEQKRGLSWN